MASLWWISGSPATGKSTLAAALIQHFNKGIIVPVDDIREWVKAGHAGPVPWSIETENQYRLGEESACLVAKHYLKAGFHVVIDACRNPNRIDELLRQQLPEITAEKILLKPGLKENLTRSHMRINKAFDSHLLDGVIEFTHNLYHGREEYGWRTIDNTNLTVEATVEQLLKESEPRVSFV